MGQKVAVFRKEHFNAAHRLHNPAWDEIKNAQVFGKCNHVNYHGHNYELVVKVIGEINEETGFVIDVKVLGDLIRKYIIEPFDHKNLNLDIPQFKSLNPTAENIAIVIYNILRPVIDPGLDFQIRLYETERNYVEYPIHL